MKVNIPSSGGRNMNITKIHIFCISIISFLLMCTLVSASSDSTGDVYHFGGYNAEVKWEFYGERDTIDITDVSQSVSGSDITVSLTVNGGITDNNKISYYIYLYKDATSYYAVEYSDGSGMATSNGDIASYPADTSPDYVFSNNGKTLSYTFSDVDTSSSLKLEAYAVEHAEYGGIAGEAWYDYAPENTAPYYASGNDGGNGSPGFEFIFVLVGVFVFSSVYKMRKIR